MQSTLEIINPFSERFMTYKSSLLLCSRTLTSELFIAPQPLAHCHHLTLVKVFKSPSMESEVGSVYLSGLKLPESRGGGQSQSHSPETVGWILMWVISYPAFVASLNSLEPNLTRKEAKDNGIFRVHLMAIEEECFIVKVVKSISFVRSGLFCADCGRHSGSN